MDEARGFFKSVCDLKKKRLMAVENSTMDKMAAKLRAGFKRNAKSAMVYFLRNDDNQSYVGCAAQPRHRLKQHNGKIVGGACFTKKHGPWEMVLYVDGFESRVQALAFENILNHPVDADCMREHMRRLERVQGGRTRRWCAGCFQCSDSRTEEHTGADQ